MYEMITVGFYFILFFLFEKIILCVFVLIALCFYFIYFPSGIMSWIQSSQPFFMDCRNNSIICLKYRKWNMVVMLMAM